MIGLALRQVSRHWRTSLGALLSAAAGVAAIVFMAAVMRGLTGALIANVVDMQTGAIVVQRQGFVKAGIEDFSLAIDTTALLPLVHAVPGVVAVSPRLAFEAVIANGQQAANVRILAFDHALEDHVCAQRSELAMEGALATEDDVLLGRELASRLTLRPGDGATLTAVAPGGRQNALDVTVRGRLDSPVPFANKRAVTMSLARAQQLLTLPGRASELGVAVTGDAPRVAAALRERLGSAYTVETWREREPRAARVVATAELLALVLSITLSILVLGFVMNATRASVEDRRQEIGTMLALGVRRKQVLGLFLTEAALIGAAAAVFGVLVGWFICAVAAHVGLELRAPGAKPFVVRPGVALADVGFASLLIIVGGVVAAFFPALAASRLSPRDALRDD